MSILRLMREDAQRELKRMLCEYEKERREWYDNVMHDELADALQPHLLTPLSTPFMGNSTKQKAIRTLCESLSPISKKCAPQPASELRDYYNARIAALRQLFKATQSEAQFPDFPQLWFDFAIKRSIPSRLTPQLAHELMTWHLKYFHVSTKQAAKATIHHFFPNPFCNPDSIGETLLEQTVALWGKLPVDVFLARKELLLQHVLHPALEELREELSAFGKDVTRWEKQAPVDEMVEAILKEAPMQKYRALVRSVCHELDSFAGAMPGYVPPQRLVHAYADSELGKYMKCSFIDAQYFPERFMDIMETEKENIIRYYSLNSK